MSFISVTAPTLTANQKSHLFLREVLLLAVHLGTALAGSHNIVLFPTLHQQTAVSTALVDVMAMPALLASCFKHMVKAGTEFVSF